VRPAVLLRVLLSIILVGAVAGACTSAPTPSASGKPDNTAMVLAEPNEPAGLNPLAGYAPNGAGKIFDGLLEHQPDGSLRPVLAAAQPVPSADGRSWTVTLRSGIVFSDGTPFGPADVVATYSALLNPAFAAPVKPNYSMLAGVVQTGPHTVRFDLAYPYVPFPDKLVLGILPAAALTTPAPVAQSAFGGEPVGTGPYTLASWTRGSQLVLKANPRYPAVLGGPPKVKTVTIRFITDDTSRAQQLRAGKLDGAALTPAQANSFAKTDAFDVLTDPSADLRAVTLPAHGAVTGDPAIRLALNYAVNRAKLTGGALAGQAVPASTPVPGVLPEFIEPGATFTFDRVKAATLLTQAGWLAGPDGNRARAGVPAAFTLDYPAGDTADAGLATQFAADAKAVGIAVTLAAVPSAQLAGKTGTDATLTASGTPFDPDLGLYPLLDPTSGSDPTGYADTTAIAALDAGHTQTDPAQRAVAYRTFQRAYLADPGLVCLVFAAHTYVMRANWNGYQQVTDGASQGVTWGPWWNLAAWTPK
jgi:peptide/nickel transport system substrate-binding protein